MGSYDTVHGGDRCGQTKALGKRMRNLVVGDAVEVVPAPMDEQQYEVFLDGQTPARHERDFLVAMTEGGYLLVAGGALQAWQAEAPAGLPLFNYLGYADAERDDDIAMASDAALEAENCMFCAAVLDGRVAELREELATERAERRAMRARAAMRSV